mgnify:FL=1
MKKSAHQIWKESKEQNLTKEEFKAKLQDEGIIIKKSEHTEKAKDILEKVNNGKISKALWDNCSDYAKKDLKRKAFLIVDEDNGEVVSIERNEVIAVDGKPSNGYRVINYYSLDDI